MLSLVRGAAAFAVGAALLAPLPASAATTTSPTASADSGSTATAALAQDGAGTIVLPPRYGNQPVPVQALRTSERAVVYHRAEGSDDGSVSLTARRLGGDRQQLPPAVSARSSLAGDQVALEVAVAGDRSASRAQVVDLASGTSTFGEPYPWKGARGTAMDYFLAATGDGWLDVRGTPEGGQNVVRHFTDGRPAVPVRPTTQIIVDAKADTSGALLLEQLDQVRRLVYVDFASGESTVLAEGDSTGSYDLSPAAVAWQVGDVIVKANRSAPATAVLRREGVRADLLAVSDGALAWVQSTVINAPGDRRLAAVTAVDGQSPVTGPQLPEDSQGLGRVDGGDFAFVAGSTGPERGIYRLAAGATSFSEMIESAGLAPPLSVEASAGRLAYSYPAATGGLETLYDQGVDRVVDELHRRGGERVIATTTGGASVTAARTAYLAPGAGTQLAVVKDGPVTVASVPVEPGTTAVAVAGHRLVTSAFKEVGLNIVPGTTYVRDLRDLSRAPRVLQNIESTALAGHLLAYLAVDGSIRVRDLDTPAPDVVVRPAGFPAGAETDGRQNRMTLLAAGNWVAWSFPSREDLARSVETRAARVSDAGATPFVLDAQPAELRLADGLLAYLDRDDRDVHVVSVTNGTDTVVGQARRAASNRTYLALDDDFVAYVAPDDTTRIQATTAHADAPPTLLGGTSTPAFSPDGDGSKDELAVAVDATRPLTEHRLEIADASGQVVRVLEGAAPDGGVRTRWNGRDDSGQVVPDGTYTWKLSGTGGDARGALVAGGAQAPLRQAVRIDRTDPARVSVNVPARVSDVFAGSRFQVTWRGSEPGLRFDVDVARLVRTSTGRLEWGPARRWLTATAATSALYTGSPFAAAPGEQLRFAVTGRDAAGNGRTAHAATTVPYDDRHPLVRLSGTWGSISASDRWGGSSRVSGIGGRRIAVTTSATTVTFIGDRCPACGRFRLVVDGRLQPIVSSYSAVARRRQVLASVTLPRGTHKVELLVVGTAGKVIRVDAVAVQK